LQAATGWAAECLGLEDEVGTVTPGKRADLVVVDGNPLQNITVLQDMQRIKLVLKGGDICVDRRVASTVPCQAIESNPCLTIQSASQAIRIVAQYTAYAILDAPDRRQLAPPRADSWCNGTMSYPVSWRLTGCRRIP